jgi:hypothetical protein
MRKFTPLALAGAAVMSAFGLAASAGATVLSADLSGYTYGNIDQHQAGINFPGSACAPTSAANSFIYLQDRYGLTGLVDTSSVATESASVNAIEAAMGTNAGGTSATGIINGIINYTKDLGISVEYQNDVGGGTQPTPQFIYNMLAAGEDVEAGILFSSGAAERSGHVITVDSIDFDTTTDTGTLGIIDPWNPTFGEGAASIVGNLTLSGGALVLSYSGGAAGVSNDPVDNPTDASSGAISLVVAESVPEPSTFALLMIGITGLAATLCQRRICYRRGKS